MLKGRGLRSDSGVDDDLFADEYVRDTIFGENQKSGIVHVLLKCNPGAFE
jgi:hypothetical protein